MYSIKYQIFSTLLALIGVFLAAKQNILSWPISILSCLIAFFIYKDKSLYGKSIFMIFAIANSFYGWYLWSKSNNDGSSRLKVTRTNIKLLVFLFILGLVSTFGFGELLKSKTDSEIALWDAFYSSYAIIAHWMMANKKLESWIVWIVVDAVFANICLHKSLYILAFKCITYVFISVYGYFVWRRAYLVRDE